MSEQKHPRLRFYATALVIFAELAHLAWEYFNGGVQSHHFLNRSDMPAISNWWGLLILPALTWFLTGHIQKRISGRKDTKSMFNASIIVGFVGSLLFGISLSIAFVNNYENVAAVLFFGLLLLAVVLPIYRAEFVLGFILAMTLTFGEILPTIIASVLAAMSATLHLLVYPSLVRLWTWVRRV